MAQGRDAASFAAPPFVRSASLSPDGRFAAFVHETDETDSLVVFELSTQTARAVARFETDEASLNWVTWKDNDTLVYSASVVAQVAIARPGSRVGRGSREFHFGRLVAVDRNGENSVPLFEGQFALLNDGVTSMSMVDRLSGDRDHILVSAQDNIGNSIWRANVRTGEATRVERGDPDVGGYFTDGVGNAVMRVESINDQAGYRYTWRPPGASEWQLLREVRRTAAATNSPDFQPIGSGPGPGQVYVLARQDDQDRAALFLFDARTGSLGEPIQRGVNADVWAPWVNPETGEIIATCEFERRLNCQARDASMQRHLRAINSFFDNAATVSLESVSTDSNRLLLLVENPIEGSAYYVYDRAAASLDLLAQIFPGIDVQALSPVQVVDYRARDGTPLWAYVTAQPGAAGPRPTIIMPHGGPESRDTYGFDPLAQFLASKGYVVVQPNFRGSIGMGRAFGDAGRRQWGRLMQDDVTDALRHMIDAGVSDPNRVCLVGGSYGGYVALAGVTLTPELYRCSVSIAGVSDLLVSLRSERQEGGRQSMAYAYWLRSIGDPRADAAQLEATSPARLVDRITAPVLLIHGTEDQIVLYDQSEIMERAMRRAGKDVRLVPLEGAGHTFRSYSRDNSLTLFRETEAFLARHLGTAN